MWILKIYSIWDSICFKFEDSGVPIKYKLDFYRGYFHIS